MFGILQFLTIPQCKFRFGFCLNKNKFYHLGLRSLDRSGPRSSICPWISLAGRNFWKLSIPNLWEPRHDQLKLWAARAPGHRGLTSRFINTFCTKPFIDWSQGLVHISFSYPKERLLSLSDKSRRSVERLKKQSARQETWHVTCAASQRHIDGRRTLPVLPVQIHPFQESYIVSDIRIFFF